MSTATEKAKALADYLARPYSRELIPNSDGTWFARIVELPGCMTEGDTDAEAIANLRDAMEAWISDALESGDPIPEPSKVEDFSGKFVVRVPKSLHRDLVRRADAEGVSLNAFVTATLAEAVHGAPRKEGAPTFIDTIFSKTSSEMHLMGAWGGCDLLKEPREAWIDKFDVLKDRPEARLMFFLIAPSRGSSPTVKHLTVTEDAITRIHRMSRSLKSTS